MRPSNALQVWAQAARFDPTVRVLPRHLGQLARKRVPLQPFSRRVLFERMAAGQVSLFTGLRVLAVRHQHSDQVQVLVNALRTAFSRRKTVSAVTGRAGRRVNLPMSTLMNRWERRRAIVSVTDLHIRGTRLEKVIDTRVLSDFNILCKASEDMAWHEMMTMVISGKGHVTDSHSDDPDGSNHCFVGRKLWLAWNTFEGRAHGLQDVERDYVPDRAHFDIETFLRLRSSRWFTVSPGVTLFLPGDLTHKVITLEHYLGVGSFYVSIPNSVRTISRWRIHGPLWSDRERAGNTPELVGKIASRATALIRRVRNLPPETQRRWGLPFLRDAVRHWEATIPASTRSRLLEEPVFNALVVEARGRQ